jgi:hypothetical protein
MRSWTAKLFFYRTSAHFRAMASTISGVWKQSSFYEIGISVTFNPNLVRLVISLSPTSGTAEFAQNENYGQTY